MHKIINYTGFECDNFRVIDPAESRGILNKHGVIRRTRMWNCVCKCGAFFVRKTASIKNERACLNCARLSSLSHVSQRFAPSNKIHHSPNKRLLTIWYRMKDRCYNKNHVSFKYYGNRGIGICDLWLNDYKAFETWALENQYEDDLSLDRINTFGNYEPENCRWATRNKQQSNRRDSVKRMFNGQMLNASEIAAITGKSYVAEYMAIKRLQKKEAIQMLQLNQAS